MTARSNLLKRQNMARGVVFALILSTGNIFAAPTSSSGSASVDFNRDVRRILSENCFACHGPDAKPRKGGKLLRLDMPDSVQSDLGGGRRAIVPKHPEKSELMLRITAKDPDDRMPPSDSGKRLTAQEVRTLEKWIGEGATYSRHWSYVAPQRVKPPAVRERSWPRNAIDSFVLARLEREKLKHAPEADRPTLIRRAALDLTGLPPSMEELDRFLGDAEPGAFERVVDRLLTRPAFGEHWARLWLDEARYADSTGYADDPPRTIWAFRDYVIRSLNANKRFDQFTIEQLAGDLLDSPTDEQLVATAFHRNTLTNNEGGTNDEEYRNVAIVDRVNTTMAVWMGTTMACAQCHNHKYDPFTQEEYFRLFAILNNTADADRGDESPFLELYTPEQKIRRKQWETELERLDKILQTPTPELVAAQTAWEKTFATDLEWRPATLGPMTSRAGAAIERLDDGTARFEKHGKTDVYTIEIPLEPNEATTAVRLETVPDDKLEKPVVGHANGNFVVSGIFASIAPSNNPPAAGRFVRVELTGKEKILSLAEVQIFSGGSNVALRGEAKQISTDFDGPARFAIDGNTDGVFDQSRTTTHTGKATDPWWEVDLKSTHSIERVVVWNRTDASVDRLNGFRILLLDEARNVVWREEGQPAPKPSAEFHPDGARPVALVAARADFSQKDFPAAEVLGNKAPATRGWGISPQHDKPHFLTLIPKEPIAIGPGSNLVLRIEQLSQFDFATLARVRVSRSIDRRASEFAKVPESTLAILRQENGSRTDAQRSEVRKHYVTIAPALQSERAEIARYKKKLQDEKPYTTVPVMRELAGDKRRTTKLQRRGNFLDVGPELIAGLPAALHPLDNKSGSSLDRMTLAHWLIDTNNPLTARVLVNRFWESIFGIGLVRTSEEFGIQGEPPSHLDLLDWLAVEFMESGWDTKHLLKLMVTSASYRQSSRVTPDLNTRDPENRLLARGPRFRLSAEMVRDQTLFVSGLLSAKMYGAPVRPPQPKMGLSAAFGSATDWETSTGEDRYRRALYTTWRRSNPYPSMASFDAPNREFCLVRRERSNTPLQALVTLNDPVYFEAAQALGRRTADSATTTHGKIQWAFRQCLSRLPNPAELNSLVELYERSVQRFQSDPDKARDVATQPIGPASVGANLAELAAWTVVGNVLLNLDEMLMKR